MIQREGEVRAPANFVLIAKAGGGSQLVLFSWWARWSVHGAIDDHMRCTAGFALNLSSTAHRMQCTVGFSWRIINLLIMMEIT